MTPAQLAEGAVKDRVFTGEQVSLLFEKKFSTTEQLEDPSNIVTVFSKKHRTSRKAVELGQISIEASWKFSTGKVTKEKQAYKFCIVPDKSACPVTAQRFLSLCGKGYPFSIVWHSSEIIGSTQQQVTASINPDLRYPYPLRATENKLSHDSGGTVALRIGLLPVGYSMFQLIISPNEQKEQDLLGAVVFGRLQRWDKDLCDGTSRDVEPNSVDRQEFSC
ncbi:hypothetical protein RvY_17342 [Ramazzottius varieornatus]|uniref:Uncharacterized protein n=1 Tax=Ramazzottius varieornatus TaxID=947166 RepID=A0A1D1W2M0_RAMVA|nr:hypothetical protein RvY_17342 [Ramazzottius varieornatus]